MRIEVGMDLFEARLIKRCVEIYNAHVPMAIVASEKGCMAVECDTAEEHAEYVRDEFLNYLIYLHVKDRGDVDA